MAFFQSKKKTDTAKSASHDRGTGKASSSKEERRAQYADVLKRPRITEKASYTTTDGGYTFVVRKDATKPEIKKAVAAVYNVTPQRVRTLPVPAKKVQSRRGRKGIRSGGKKAVVYLKEGERIDFV